MSLKMNSMITIYLNDEILATDGEKLSEPTELYFTTEMKPLYSSARSIRKIAGPYVSEISDDLMNQLLHQFSVTAEELAPENCNDRRWEVWAGYFALYSATLTLLTNTEMFIDTGGTKVFKQLGDFSVSREGGGAADAGINRLLNWLECELYKYGYAVKNCTPPLLDCLGMTDARARMRDYEPSIPGLTEKGKFDPHKFYEGRRWLVDKFGNTAGDGTLIASGKKYTINTRSGFPDKPHKLK